MVFARIVSFFVDVDVDVVIAFCECLASSPWMSFVWNDAIHATVNKLFWSQLCFVAPPKLSTIIIGANIMCRCHWQNNSNLIPFVPKHIFDWGKCYLRICIKTAKRHCLATVNGWKRRKKQNYEHNDHLFKLNRSTKSSSVLVNCLQSALFHFVDGDRATFRSVEQVFHINFFSFCFLLPLRIGRIGDNL